MRKKVLLVLLIIFLFCMKLEAHPHVWLDVFLEFDGKLLVTWIFDEGYSISILNDCDLDFDDSFNEDEKKNVYKSYFSNLKNYHYFLEIYINDKPVEFSILDFNPLVDKEKLTVSYDFSINMGPVGSGDTIKLRFRDDTNYVAFSMNDDLFIKSPNIRDYTVDSDNWVIFQIK